MFILIGDLQFHSQQQQTWKSNGIPKSVMYQENRSVPQMIILMQN